MSIDRTDRLAQRGDRIGSAPIDAAFLASQTGSDPQLQRDLLALFISQSAIIARRLEEPRRPSQDVRDELHLLKGSARGIGAGRVAEVAEAAERSLARHGLPKLQTSELSALKNAIAEACAFAATLASRI